MLESSVFEQDSFSGRFKPLFHTHAHTQGTAHSRASRDKHTHTHLADRFVRDATHLQRSLVRDVVTILAEAEIEELLAPILAPVLRRPGFDGERVAVQYDHLVSVVTAH